MYTTVRELWLTGWKGKKGGLHERVREREKERGSARSMGNNDRHKRSSLAMGVAIFLLWYIKFVRVF